MSRKSFKLAGVALAVLSAVAFFGLASANATTIYLDTFARTGSLQGCTPDVTTDDATWLTNSSGDWQTDGAQAAYSGGSRVAALPFVPEAGKIYTLSLSADANATDGGEWTAFGFRNSADLSEAFYPDGIGYCLLQANGVTTPRLGPGLTTALTSATGDGMLNVWTTILDASSANAANWTFEWKLNGTTFQAATAYGGTGPSITHVGFGGGSNNVGTVYVDNFSLTSIPEPSMLVLLAMGLVGLLAYAWRKRK